MASILSSSQENALFQNWVNTITHEQRNSNFFMFYPSASQDPILAIHLSTSTTGLPWKSPLKFSLTY